MPTISIVRDDLFRAIGKTMTDEEFEELCFEFGIELDEVTTEKTMVAKERGEEVKEVEEDEIIYKIDIPSNRYDILCLEGLATALRVFLGTQTVPEFSLKQGSEQIIIKPETKQIRPFVVGAILRNITFTPTSYKSFIELQDKLHQNICRKRTLVAIGTHDYDTIQGPFSYEALPPEQITFKALNQQQELAAPALFDFYRAEKVSQIKAYLPIIEDSPVYPVIYDANRVVLSLPPIINGDHSKITLNTKNVFIECTATDLTKANVTLQMIVTAFSEYCDDKFSFESVKIIDSDGNESETPRMDSRDVKVSCDYVNSIVGIQIEQAKMCELLIKMGLISKPDGDSHISVRAPITRADILHPCDVAEDVAIAYGYNNIQRSLPKSATISGEQQTNQLSDLMRQEIANAGYIEILTFSLMSLKNNYEKLNRAINLEEAVTTANPKTEKTQLIRTTLLPGLLKTLRSNRSTKLPIKVFEFGDVVVQESGNPKNIRTLSALYCDKTTGFETLHALLDVVMRKLGHNYEVDYELREAQQSTFFPGRQAEIILKKEGKEASVGIIGVIHPDVMKNFKLAYPVSAMELNFESLI